MTNTELLKKIQSEFNIVHNRTDIKGINDWTNEFKKVLKTIGEKERYKVYTKFRKKDYKRKDSGEWLFDLCWSNEEKGTFKGLKLICEIEWSEKIENILEDFHKLAVGKSDLKIMIVQYKGEEKFQNIKKSCEQSVHKLLYNDGGKYILVGSGNGKDDNKVKWVELWKKNN